MAHTTLFPDTQRFSILPESKKRAEARCRLKAALQIIDNYTRRGVEVLDKKLPRKLICCLVIDNMTVFEGILPAVVTPLHAGLQFDKGAFERLLAALHGAGVHGVYVCGHTGEGLLQGVEHPKHWAEIAMR